MSASLIEVIGVVSALFVQTGAFIYWAGKLTARVEEHGNRLDRVQISIQHVADQVMQHLDRGEHGKSA